MSKPHISIIFHGRFPSEKAAALWVAKLAEGFGRNGFQTTLIVPRRKGNSTDPAAFHRLNPTFTVTPVFALDLFNVPVLKSLAFATSWVTFAIAALIYLKRHSSADAIIYANDPQAVSLLSFFFRNCFYELHVVPTEKLFLYRMLFRRIRGFITITKWGGNELVRIFGIPRERIMHAPGAVDITAFDIPVSKEEARERLQLSLDEKLVLYTGHLYEWKGVDTLAQAAPLLPSDVAVTFVGGTSHDVDTFRRKYGTIPNIRIIGHQPHRLIPLWQKAADVLVLPNTGRKRISRYNTSPMKLFEYMASGVPIIASDLPSIREIITEQTAVFAIPDDPASFAQQITTTLADPRKQGRFAKAAQHMVHRFTWENRAEHILAFLNKTAHSQRS